MSESDRTDKPPFVQAEHTSLADADRARAGQLRMLMSVDDLVAQVTDTLRRTGEARDTIAFFLSDNGYLWGEHGIIAKGYPYGPGVQVPFLMRWPRHVGAGSVDRRLGAMVDVAPTILDAAGVESDLSVPMDGRSLLDPSWRRDRMLLEYWHWRGSSAPAWASTWGEGYQYTEYYGVGGRVVAREYYDLARDPWQLTNLLNAGNPHNDLGIARLHRTLTADRSCIGTACP
jgi:arylsulfatase A-like enzyme